MDNEMTIIRGERNIAIYCKHKWGETPRFCESFAHVADKTVERIYEKSPTDEYYEQYYIIYDLYSHRASEYRHEARMSIREGRWEQYKPKTARRQ